MTAQVIDTLSVVVEADAKKFKTGTAEVRKGFDETKKSATSFLSSIKTEAASAFAILAGGYGAKELIKDATETSAALGLLAHNLEVQTQALNAWGNMASMFGGSAAGLQGTISNLVGEFEKFKLTGESALTPMMNKFADLDRSDPFKFLEGLKGKLDALNDPRQSKFILDFLHIDQGTQNLLLNTTAEKLHRLLSEQQKKNLVDKDGAAQAQKLNESYQGFLQTLDGVYRKFVGEISPGIEEGFIKIETAAAYLGDHKELVVGFFVALGIAAGVALLPIIAGAAPISALGAGLGLLYDEFTAWKAGGEHILPWDTWEQELNDSIAKIKELIDGIKELKSNFTLGGVGKVAGTLWDMATWEARTAGKKVMSIANNLGFGNSPIAKALLGAEGDYNSVNLGKAKGYKSNTVDLASKTIDQVLSDQAAGKYNAAGRYQMIPGTLKMAKEGTHFSGTELFNEHTQDALGAWILANKRKGLGDYISGKSNDLHGAQKGFSAEWASVADPDTGASAYPGNNKASISAVEAANLINRQRAWQAGNTTTTTGNTSSNETHIGTINIQTAAADAPAIGKDIHKAITNQSDFGMR